MEELHSSMATCKGVLPFLFWMFKSQCLFDAKHWQISLQPCAMAMCKGVSPWTFVRFRSHWSLPTIRRKISKLLLLAATWRGVSPFLFWRFTLHCKQLTRLCVASMFPTSAAICSGVLPDLFCICAFIVPVDCTSIWLKSVAAFFSVAMCKTVLPSLLVRWQMHLGSFNIIIATSQSLSAATWRGVFPISFWILRSHWGWANISLHKSWLPFSATICIDVLPWLSWTFGLHIPASVWTSEVHVCERRSSVILMWLFLVAMCSAVSPESFCKFICW